MLGIRAFVYVTGVLKAEPYPWNLRGKYIHLMYIWLRLQMWKACTQEADCLKRFTAMSKQPQMVGCLIIETKWRMCGRGESEGEWQYASHVDPMSLAHALG